MSTPHSLALYEIALFRIIAYLPLHSSPDLQNLCLASKSLNRDVSNFLSLFVQVKFLSSTSASNLPLEQQNDELFPFPPSYIQRLSTTSINAHKQAFFKNLASTPPLFTPPAKSKWDQNDHKKIALTITTTAFLALASSSSNMMTTSLDYDMLKTLGQGLASLALISASKKAQSTYINSKTNSIVNITAASPSSSTANASSSAKPNADTSVINDLEDYVPRPAPYFYQRLLSAVYEDVVDFVVDSRFYGFSDDENVHVNEDDVNMNENNVNIVPSVIRFLQLCSTGTDEEMLDFLNPSSFEDEDSTLQGSPQSLDLNAFYPARLLISLNDEDDLTYDAYLLLLNDPSEPKTTGLFTACECSNLGVVRVLCSGPSDNALNHRDGGCCDVNYTDKEGYNAAHFAVLGDRSDGRAVDILREVYKVGRHEFANITPNASSNNSSKKERMRRLQPLDFTLTTNSGFTPQQLARRLNVNECVTFLSELGQGDFEYFKEGRVMLRFLKNGMARRG